MLNKQYTFKSQIIVVLSAFILSAFVIYSIYAFSFSAAHKLGFSFDYIIPDGSINLIWFFFLMCLTGTVFPFFLFIGWILRTKIRRECPDKLPFVSIIIPAFNEQETVSKSIECALAQDYPEFEILVVDDGSSDFTPLLIDHPDVTSVSLPQNQGKANAVNLAISKAKGDLVLFSDSDSHLHPDAIKHLIGYFNNPKIAAVAGQLIVRQKRGFVALWQTIEYIFGQAIVKIAQCGSGSSITVCPGPICIYRRDLLLSLGGFKDRTIVEDFDLTLEVIAAGYEVIYEPRALAWTSTPETFSALGRQRTRWYRGNLQVFKVHKNLLFNTQHGALGIFWMPYILLIGFGGAILEASIFLCFPFIFYFSSAPIEASLFGLFLFVIFELITIIQYILVLYLDRNLHLSLIIAACCMKPYQLFLTWIRLVALYREFRKEKVTW